MRTLVLLPACLLLSAAAAAQTPAGQATPVPGAAKRCISTFNTGNPVPLPDGRVLIQAEPRSGQSYAAVFKGRCPGVHPDSRFVVVHETGGSQLCEGDRIRAFEPEDIIPGPVCVIDHFEHYAKPPRAGR